MFERHRRAVDGPLVVRSTPDHDGIVVVALGGELDRSNVSTAASVLDAVFAQCDSRVVIDLTELEFLDAGGVQLLAKINQEREANAGIRVIPSSSLGVSRILAATGLDALLKTVQDGSPSPRPQGGAPAGLGV